MLSGKNLVDGQVITNHVTDRALINVLSVVDRRDYVKRRHWSLANSDVEITLGENKDRCLWRVGQFARLVQALNIESSDIVLDIGSASGYSSVVFAQLCEMVISLEEQDDWHELSSKQFKKVGSAQLHAVKSDFEKGAADHGPFEVIFSNIPVDSVPQNWLNQLAPAGRLGVIVQMSQYFGHARIYKKVDNKISFRNVFEYCLPVPTRRFMKVEKFAF